MSVRSRILSAVVAAGVLAAVGCGDGAPPEPKKPDNAPTLQPQKPAGVPGAPGGGAGKPGGASQ